MKKLSLLTFLVFSVCFVAIGQQAAIKGRVTDSATKEGLPGVNIVIIGTTLGTTTDGNGDFVLNAGSNDALMFSFVGYLPQQVVVGTQTIIDVALSPDATQLDEVIVVGYTSEKKKDITGAVGVLEMKQVKDMPFGNIMKNMQGRLPGVSIITDGSPSSPAVVRIRGNGTLNNNDPLYVIDGIPTKSGMHELNPADIESVQVLKDAASASIYGARAANGVIIVTTKRANASGVKLTVDSNWSTQFYTSKLDPLDAYHRGLVFWQASVNANLNPTSPIYKYVWNNDFANPVLGSITTNEYLDAGKTMLPADTRWFNEISQASMTQSYNVNLSKGGENGNMFFSVGLFDNKGIIKETHFSRVNTRFNSDYKLLNGKVTVGENFQLTLQKDVQINAGDVLFTSLVQQPVVPVHTIDGGWGGPVSGMTDRQNPVRLIQDNKQNHYQYARAFGNAYLAVNPIRNLTLKSSLGIDYSLYYSRGILKKYVSGFLSEPDNKLTTSSNVKGNIVWSNTMTYGFNLKEHKVDVLAGSEQITNTEEWLSASRENFISEGLDYAYLSNGANTQLNAGGGTKWSLMSFFGKLNYSFADKYLASFTLRRDGSSRFGRNNRYGNFPAASVGWRISEEKFLKPLVGVDTDLKLRASWGQNGNQEIDPLAAYNTYRAVYGKEDPIWDNPSPPAYRPALGTAYDIFGADQGQLPSGYIVNQQGNDNLKWETTTQTDIGLDYVIKKFSGSIDYFQKQTKDILYFRTLLATVGEASGQYVNGGTVRNSGLEMVITYQDQVGPVRFDISANGATLKNRVIDMPSDLFVRLPLSGNIPNDAKKQLVGSQVIGHSINSMYGYVADGLFQNADEVSAHATQPGKGIGRIRYKDLDNNGIIDNNDQSFIGTADPGFSYGLNINASYKNFSFSVFFQGVTGIQYYNAYKTYTDFASLWPGTNWGTRTLNAWSPQNTSSTIPRLTIIDSNNEGRVSTYFIENASYMKLRNVQVSYRLPESINKRLKTTGARVYLQGQNLFTFKSKHYTAPDPENPNYAFPIPAIVTCGLNVSF
ncbi:MAG: TonB-dependent receptor [Cyclobacteriaceae bacterium]|nr:TonB-dependent receptor [Cyclobacteriaceae bacterium]